MPAICIEHVVCERITLLSFALYYPVRSYARIYVRISTIQQQSVCLFCCLVCLVKRSVQTSKREANSHWKFVYRLDVLLPFVPGSIALEFWWSSSSITNKTGG